MYIYLRQSLWVPIWNFIRLSSITSTEVSHIILLFVCVLLYCISVLILLLNNKVKNHKKNQKTKNQKNFFLYLNTSIILLFKFFYGHQIFRFHKNCVICTPDITNIISVLTICIVLMRIQDK